MKINAKQLPIKAHFFFFMAAMGPILPFITVYGRQLGVAPKIMGTFTSVLPILFLIAKPAFGFLVDYFRNVRKVIFIGLLITTSFAFVSMYFLPGIDVFLPLLDNQKANLNITLDCDNFISCESRNISNNIDDCPNGKKSADCYWSCNENTNNYSASVIFINREINFSLSSFCLVDPINETFDCDKKRNDGYVCQFSCSPKDEKQCLYGSLAFWGFVILVSIGCIGFNVSNSISDAICFDVLGEGGQMGYGRQRVFGTIGFGVTALLAGYAVDLWSEGQTIKIYTPAFVLVFIFTCFDILCCTKLELPIMTGSTSIAKDVYKLVKRKPVAIFLCFATLAGVFDGFIIYFLLWYLEDLATITGHMGQIKLIEGLIVAAETLGGEVVFFSLSGKILKKFGYGYSFVFCFFCYALRLGLVSIAPNPWWVILIEFFMQGPTYAMCYTTIVAFASTVAPPGTSATVQGIVAGMDDGFGFALGSLAGGFMYEWFGGAATFRIFSSLSVITAMVYFLLHVTYLKHAMPQTKVPSDKNRSPNVHWKSPGEAAKDTHIAAEEQAQADEA